MEREKLTPQASDDPRHRGRTPRPFQPPKRPYAIVSEEEKAAILDAAKTAILEGQDSLQHIAEHHHISHRTLQYWLAQLGEEYTTLRKAWIDAQLVEAGEELEKVGCLTLDDSEGTAVFLKGELEAEQLRLARAREIWKKATWYAERRDPTRYGPKQEVSVDRQVHVHIHRGGSPALPSPGEGQAPPDREEVVDLEPTVDRERGT